MNDLDTRVAELAARYRPVAERILKEAIRIPADYVDKPADDGGDPSCGLSNHEKPRLEYMKRAIVEIGAVRRPEDVGYDGFGNLVWTLEDPGDGIPAEKKRIIYWDGHTDTVKALRPAWREKTGGIDPYDGLFDANRLDRGFVKSQLGYMPPEAEWGHLLFGRGSTDQLSGVVSQIMASKVLVELIPEGSLRGAIVRSYGTVAEEDNDGGAPMYVMRKVLPGAPPELIPDAVILTEGTGDSAKGALGIYRGQRGRMQIEVSVTGRSCHGSMPWEGRNPLEFGAPIVTEAARRYDSRQGFLDHPFLGHGTRTASWARLDTPSDCAVPERFVFRFDRRLTIGETPEQAVADVEGLPSVAAARAAGLKVAVAVPTYDEPTWSGFVLGNPQIYMGWVTPEDHPAVHAYRGVVTPHVAGNGARGALRKEPRVDRWIFSTDGVGFPVRAGDDSIPVPDRKSWVVSGAVKHPAMIGIGPGIEQNAHTIGECVDMREVVHAVALLARFPSAFVSLAG
jgi:putative selenium metabolism hydrolase